MTILWCGAEDIDFPGIGNATYTYPPSYRAAYARCALAMNGIGATYVQGTPFEGGAVTSLWLSAQYYPQGYGPYNFYGAGNNTLGNANGIYLGIDNNGHLQINSLTGATFTNLATSTNQIAGNTLNKIDLQISNYGAAGTVTAYVNGVQWCTYTGNIAIAGLASFNCVNLYNQGGGESNTALSEFIVSSADSRSLSLATLPPNGNGSTDQWTGTYTSINPVSINDANQIYVNTAAQNQQVTVNALPSGVFAVQAVKIAARAAVSSSGSTVAHLNLGVYNGTTLAAGAEQAPGNAYGTLESLLLTNPMTAAAWQQTDIATLQLNFQSNT